MFEEKKHRVADRIVSITQPFVRPIVRGKAKTPVEFGAKYDASVDENGHARLEKASFDAYNECTVFKDVVERCKKRKGGYPKSVLVDQVYRTKEKGAYCEERGIVMSRRKPGRPPEDVKERRKAEQKERRNDVDRIEGRTLLQPREALLRRRADYDEAVEHHARQHRARCACSEPVRRRPFFCVFYFMDAPDGRTTFDFVEVQEDAA